MNDLLTDLPRPPIHLESGEFVILRPVQLDERRRRSYRNLRAVVLRQQKVSQGMILPPPLLEAEELQACEVPTIPPLTENFKEILSAKHYVPTIVPGSRQKTDSEEPKN